jgi:hypothetical protein
VQPVIASAEVHPHLSHVIIRWMMVCLWVLVHLLLVPPDTNRVEENNVIPKNTNLNTKGVFWKKINMNPNYEI